MKITPLDIEKQQFKTGFRGYNVADVDAFLGMVAREFESITVENIELKDSLKRREALLSEFRAREEALKDTMITAQKATSEIKVAAQREAQLITAQAEFQAEKIVSAAEDRKLRIIDDINELKRQRVQWVAHLEGLIESHRKLLEVQKTGTALALDEKFAGGTAA